ncbi:MAG TPA: hypothetical protein PKE38_15480 [Ignavibacteriaceae bacterium]|nr:hypothetical protein [Ignavibacteriaceae bacterium]
MQVDHRKNLQFVILTSVIFLTTYALYTFSQNTFQDYIFGHHVEILTIPHANIMALYLSILIQLLCILKSLQSTIRQRWLMLGLIVGLIFVLSTNISVVEYPLIPGLSNSIFDLTEPWRQLYVPPVWRATIEGVTASLAGMLDLLSIDVESYMSSHLSQKRRYFTMAFLMLLLFLFAILTRRIKPITLKNSANQLKYNIWTILKTYPYIFIACLFSGFNTGIFANAYMLAKEVLPDFPVKYYQYAVNVGSIIGPFVVGWVADRKGIFLVLIWLFLLVIPVKMLTALVFFVEFEQSPHFYYLVAGIEGALAAGFWLLNISLVGERLRFNGIFRMSALSNLFFGLGLMSFFRIFEFFSYSFLHLKIVIGLINFFALGVLWYYYQKFPTEESSSSALVTDK